MSKKLINELGNKYGKITIIGFDEEKRKWIGQCECGKIGYYNGFNLRSKPPSSCSSCSKIDNNYSVKDLKNQRFGKLVVIEYKGKSLWLCKCDCGNVCTRKSSTLIKGCSTSCGCNSIKHKMVHDDNFKKLYLIWKGMKKRCNNKNCKSYPFYGGKGIKLCDEWNDNFDAFYDWSIKSGYRIIDGDIKDKLCIDRIDNNKDYCPENCRWISISENAYRVSENNIKLEELMSKSTDEMVQQYIERKMEHNLEIQKEKREIRSGFFPCRRNYYCTIINDENNKQFLFKNYKTASMFLNITSGAISYRIKYKNGILTKDWRIERIDKEQYDCLRNEGIEVII